jgi:integrase
MWDLGTQITPWGVLAAAVPGSAKTVQNRLGALSPALRQAVHEGLIARNPLDAVDKPQVSRTLPSIVGEVEAATIVRASEGSDLESLIRLALATGARLGELLALRWSDVDVDRKVVTITRTLAEARPGEKRSWYYFTDTKGKRGRSVAIAPTDSDALKAHRTAQLELRLQFGKAWKDLNLVFPNVWQLRNVAPGTPLRPTTVSRQFRRLADAAGQDGVRFHDLRHAHASIALRAGTPPNMVAERLGHSDVALTLRIYAHCLPGQQTDAAAVVAGRRDEALAAL